MWLPQAHPSGYALHITEPLTVLIGRLERGDSEDPGDDGMDCDSQSCLDQLSLPVF